jgi:hypothetical protein
VLERTDHTLAEPAERFGYSSDFHFSPGGLVFRHHRLRR